MPWQSLTKETLSKKAQVLAGPILRAVTPASVTVWLALQKSGKVTLTVVNQQGAAVMDGTRRTIAVGQYLHIVAVTATALSPWGDLQEGMVYRYDLVFDFDGMPSMTLAVATHGADFGYPAFSWPSFVLPPADVNLLRVICGSCRKASGAGIEHLSLVDALINQTQATTPLFRPHQLLLMGDQIYADDVADALLLMLTNAGDTLLGWTEVLPAAVTGGPFKAADRPAYTRWNMLNEAGFTSVDLRSHLLSLGEYLSMYLFAWSDVLWPAPNDPVPSYEEIKKNVQAVQANFPADGKEYKTVWKHLLDAEKDINQDITALGEFRRTLTKVRKALANIPCYMIFDDHEVTDDWNMTRSFCKGVYGHDIGVRVVQNALVAYALCQHWGNVPEQFESAGGAGYALLQLLDTADPTAVNAFKQKATLYDQKSPDIRGLVGVPDSATLTRRLVTQPDNLFHDANSLVYNFTVEGLGHQIIFTDTRTWRSFPNVHGEASHLLSIDQFKAQILDTPNLRTVSNVDRVLLVVLTTNAPPTELIRGFTRHDWLSNEKERHPDIFESWELPSVPFDRLLKVLTDKLPVVSGQHYGPVILLSGDVHQSFATRLVYEATTRFEDDAQMPQRATAFVAQLVASSFKKQTGDTVDIHREGYRFNPTHLFTPDHVQEGYVGWNVPKAGPARAVAWGMSGPVNPVTVDHDHPTLSITAAIPETPPGFQLKASPDYRYRLEYLAQFSSAASDLGPIVVPPLVITTAADRKLAATYLKGALVQYQKYNGEGRGGGDIVGLNNLCEVTFEWGAGDDKFVTHRVRWFDAGTDPVLLQATYRIKLDPKDFPDITPAVQP